MQSSHKTKRNFFGILLVGFGTVLLLHNLNLIPDVPAYLFSWKIILPVVGIYDLIVRGKIFNGLLLIGVGAYFLVPDILGINVPDYHLLWPAMLIVFGLKFLLERKDKKEFKLTRDSSKIDSDNIEISTFMSGENRNISSYNFTGGYISSVMGGVELDLTNCTLAQGGAIIDFSVVMGGTTLIVPREWNVKSEISLIMAGIEDSVFNKADSFIDPAAELLLTGRVIMGGIEIKRM